MNCQRSEEALGELVDGARIDEARRIDVDAHLRDCASCRALLADLRQIRAAAARLPQDPVPARAWSRIASQLPSSDPAPLTARVFRVIFGTPRLRLAWGAAATVALAVLA